MTAQDNQQSHREAHIREDTDCEKQYVIHPEDNDLFVRTGRQVIEGCRLSISVEVWLEECHSMFEHVHQWATERSDAVKCCYGAPRGAGLAFFVVPKADEFNFDLADELAELSIALKQYNVGTVELYQIPTGEIERFVAKETARLVYRDAGSAPETVET